jgi:hypothetical protein
MRGFSLLVLLAGIASADTLTLRDGRTVNGSFLGGDSRTIRFASGDRVENFSVDQISSITFADVAPPARPARDDAPPPPREDRRELRQERHDDPPAGGELRAGTAITIRMIDSIDSQRDQMGKTFRASLDEPVVDSNGNTIIARGADAVVKLVDDRESGKITGKTILTLNLVSISVNGRMVDVNSMNVTEQSASRTGRSEKVIGGTAAVGAIIGAIAGGGKGAAIGAGAGAGAGTVAEVATKGQRVHIPSETRLTFTLQDPVRL